jgi:predicted TPR repeat methyltransferase
VATDLGEIGFSPGGEEWIEYGPLEERRRVAFHDYAALYRVPGLYERVFYDELGMASADVVVGLYAGAVEELGRDGTQERVFDLGAGNGIGGEVLRREVGPELLVGLDLEPAAREATLRDRPGTYDDYLIADLAGSPATFDELAAHSFTAVVAVSAIGAGHIPMELLAETIERLLEPGGLFAFAVAEALVPAFFDDFFGLVDAERMGSRDYVHRRTTEGAPDRASAVVARLR